MGLDKLKAGALRKKLLQKHKDASAGVQEIVAEALQGCRVTKDIAGYKVQPDDPKSNVRATLVSKGGVQIGLFNKETGAFACSMEPGSPAEKAFEGACAAVKQAFGVEPAPETIEADF